MLLSLAPVERIIRRPAFQYVMLFSVTIFAIALRFYKLGQWSMWADELYTVESAQNIFTLFATDLPGAIMSHPFTSILINWSFSQYGISGWSARLAPAIIGAISIPILYFPIRKNFGTPIALVFSVLLAMSPWHFFWSQNARFYPALMLFSTLAILAFYYGIEKDRPWFMVLFLLFFGLAASERLTGGFIVPIVVLYLILLKLFRFETPPGFNLRNLSIVFVPGTIVAIIVGWRIFSNPSLWIDEFVGDMTIDAVEIFMQYVRGIDYQILIVGGVGALIFFFSKKDRASLLLISAVTVPLLGTMAASFVQFTHGRYTFIALPFWLILASYAIVELGSKITDKNAQLIYGAVLFALFVMVPIDEISTIVSDFKGGRPSWQEAFDYIESYHQPGEKIIANNPDVVTQYYLGEDVPDMRVAEGETDIEVLSNSETRIWFAIAGTSRMDRSLRNWVYDKCQEVYFDGDSTRVYLCDPDYPPLP